MNKWYFTFGTGHLLRDYVIVIAGDFRVARAKMCEQFGDRWCSQYNEEQGKEIVKKWGYKLIDV